MKIREVIVREAQVQQLQPSIVKQQQRVGKVVKQIAASDQQQEPTEMDKVLATRRYVQMQKAADNEYAKKLEVELKNMGKYYSG